ncbi:ankyrin repeat and SOCS box protein 18 isoform X1 [Rana temporaria]|uniref:ankyrin repeat and SOCS box protein 18 isoform X1 n=1 Tax=Rana temporaria TaxID=8407 RepID=UPI001AAC6E25|nr:ankyrin repeat and SOCS box protein 18 isoform X1 [Rana temporaria]
MEESVRSRVMHKLQVITEMGYQQHPGPENIFLAALETGNLNLVQLLGDRHANCVLSIRGEEMGYQSQTPARFGLTGLWTLEYTQELTSPLCITCSRGYAECVRYLLHRRADPNAAPGGRSPLHEACAAGHDDCVQLLLEYGANPNKRSDAGQTPLHLCQINTSLRCAELLLQYGALVNEITDTTQDSALHIAARLGLLDHVDLYIRRGALINSRNGEGETPLIAACTDNGGEEESRLEICRLLLKKGADPEAQDQQERRPLHHACRKAENRLVELLLAARVDVNAADYNGVQPLSCVLQNAEIYRQKKTHLSVCALLNHGARCVYPEAFGKVLQCCSGLPDVISLLYNSYLSLRIYSKWRKDIPDDVLQTHRAFYTAFFNLSGSVRSLQHLCRFTLRKHFGSQCYLFIPLLPVPPVIKDYLLLITEQSGCLL